MPWRYRLTFGALAVFALAVAYAYGYTNGAHAGAQAANAVCYCARD